MNTLTEKISTRLSLLNLMNRQSTQIHTYVEYLLRVNQKVSLTRVGDFDEWFTSHVEDSILSYKEFACHNFNGFVDCGSGNGLPGIVYAILSDLPFTLCDVDLRKCEFLKSATHKLGLKGDVFSKPISQFVPNYDGKDFCYVYRGLGPDSVLYENFKLREENAHFRMISSAQTSLFQGSFREKYYLSDKSLREIEIFL